MASGFYVSVNQNIFLLQSLVAQKTTQFNGFAQHESQEFMAVFLDGLSEVCCSEYTIQKTLHFQTFLRALFHYIILIQTEVNVKKTTNDDDLQ